MSLLDLCLDPIQIYTLLFGLFNSRNSVWFLWESPLRANSGSLCMHVVWIKAVQYGTLTHHREGKVSIGSTSDLFSCITTLVLLCHSRGYVLKHMPFSLSLSECSYQHLIQPIDSSHQQSKVYSPTVKRGQPLIVWLSEAFVQFICIWQWHLKPDQHDNYQLVNCFWWHHNDAVVLLLSYKILNHLHLSRFSKLLAVV